MSGRRAITLGAVGILVFLAIVLVTGLIIKTPISIRGAVVTQDPTPAKELPISDVEITVAGRPAIQPVRSDPSGLFNIPLGIRDRVGLPVTLRFRHPDYQPFDLPGVAADKLYVAHLAPLGNEAHAGPEVKISNVAARYSMRFTSTVNIGSAVKTFQIMNTGNVPCKGKRPCSPDGKWKAAVGSVTVDAGEGNEFHNVRASCVAGPCPFTKIRENSLTNDGRTLHVSALDWSDTVTFLVEAEVYRPMASDVLRQSYPVIFDRGLTFTLPPNAEGVSIQAELDSTPIVFPLGPTVSLSWASCQVLVNKDQTKVFRCELKQGYRFS